MKNCRGSHRVSRHKEGPARFALVGCDGTVQASLQQATVYASCISQVVNGMETMGNFSSNKYNDFAIRCRIRFFLVYVCHRPKHFFARILLCVFPGPAHSFTRFNRRGASPLWGVEACSLPSRRPNPIPASPPYVVRTPHLHGAPTTEETVKL